MSMAVPKKTRFPGWFSLTYGTEAVAVVGGAHPTSLQLDAGSALARYNLSVALFMSGRPADALPQIEEAARLDPNDRDAIGFLDVVRRELGQR